jgi:transcriptional regulator of acetoin/glycerol metabolism
MGRYGLDDRTEKLQERKARQALEACSGNVGRASKLLGIGRRTLYAHLKRYGINPNEYRPAGYRQGPLD